MGSKRKAEFDNLYGPNEKPNSLPKLPREGPQRNDGNIFGVYTDVVYQWLHYFLDVTDLKILATVTFGCGTMVQKHLQQKRWIDFDGCDSYANLMSKFPYTRDYPQSIKLGSTELMDISGEIKIMKRTFGSGNPVRLIVRDNPSIYSLDDIPSVWFAKLTSFNVSDFLLHPFADVLKSMSALTRLVVRRSTSNPPVANPSPSSYPDRHHDHAFQHAMCVDWLMDVLPPNLIHLEITVPNTNHASFSTPSTLRTLKITNMIGKICLASISIDKIDTSRSPHLRKITVPANLLDELGKWNQPIQAVIKLGCDQQLCSSSLVYLNKDKAVSYITRIRKLDIGYNVNNYLCTCIDRTTALETIKFVSTTTRVYKNLMIMNPTIANVKLCNISSRKTLSPINGDKRDMATVIDLDMRSSNLRELSFRVITSNEKTNLDSVSKSRVWFQSALPAHVKVFGFKMDSGSQDDLESTNTRVGPIFTSQSLRSLANVEILRWGNYMLTGNYIKDFVERMELRGRVVDKTVSQ